VYLYYPTGYDNPYIDASNTMQLFRAMVHHADPALVQWSVPTLPVSTGPEYLYTAPTLGGPQTLRIDAQIPGTTPLAADWAIVTLLDYSWPGIMALPAP
jgi:hypothetical protein